MEAFVQVTQRLGQGVLPVITWPFFVVLHLWFLLHMLPNQLPNRYDLITFLLLAWCPGLIATMTAVGIQGITAAVQVLETMFIQNGMPTYDRMMREYLLLCDHLEPETGHNFSVVLIPPDEVCPRCGNALGSAIEPSHIMLYGTPHGTIQGTIYKRKCTTRGNSTTPACSVRMHYGYYSYKKMQFRTRSCLDLPYFVSSNSTGFQMSFFHKSDSSILFGHNAFQCQANIYNRNHGYTELEGDTSDEKVAIGTPRKALNHKRLIEAWMLVSFLRLAGDYELINVKCLDTAILLNMDSLHQKFERKYARHRCDCPGNTP